MTYAYAPTPAQQAEIDKYPIAYENPDYRMGQVRRDAVHTLLRESAGDPLNNLRDLLDVGTGRGETLDIAIMLGYMDPNGTEVVPALIHPPVTVFAHAWWLPFQSGLFHTVTCFDVIEHLLPDDAEPTVREIERVAAKRILLSIADYPSGFCGATLHVNVRTVADWTPDLIAWLPGWRVTLRRDVHMGSPVWEAVR